MHNVSVESSVLVVLTQSCADCEAVKATQQVVSC
jgi:hypothetical protein